MKSRLSPLILLERLSRPALTLALLLVMVADALPQVSETFNSSGTFTVPSGVTEVTVECWGGGGRGGSRSSDGRGGGGGGGAYVRSVLTVTPGNYTVTVGGGSASNNQPGEDSWFGTSTTIMAKGGATVGNNNTNGANGGSAAASIGAVKFSGGDGANAPGGSGGGGGSSAGNAADGTSATNINGATAPAGGGDGGNGRNGNANGFPGSDPGGGGGGAERNTLTRNGGNGGDGQVIVSYDYPNGLCMPVAAYNALPDNGCITNNNRVIPVEISGLPTTLGTNPGNARLESVEVIVSHTWNRDIHISLTSPSAVTRNLILDRFGNGDNLGDPTNCPGSPLVFADGGTALIVANTSNVTGTYAPEETLAGFTGNPNGNWTFTICDNEAQDFGNVRYLKLNFCSVPEITSTTSNSPACSNVDLTLSVVASGTGLGYAWTGTGSFSPNTTSANVTVSGAASGNYGITVSNSCGSDNTNVAVTVNTAATIYADTDGDGFGDPADFITGCLPVAGYVANNTDNCPTLSGLIGDACDDSNASTINDMIDGSCVCTGTVAVYYSQGSGDVTDDIWDAVAVGTPGPAVWTAASNMVIQSGHVVTNTADVDLKDLDVQAGGELVLNTGVSMNVNGTAADLDGTITAAYGSILALLCASATALNTTGTPVLSNLVVSTASGTTLSGNLDFTGTLDLVDGTFDASGGTVRLLSDATNTGNLGQVGATANYAGNMTVQRYIPAGATRWRLLGSPVDGSDISDWDADFLTAGFPGSNYPTFDNPVGSNILWPSIREYDETATGVANDGLVGVASTATLLDAGKGFAAWCGDNLTNTAAFTVDVTGPPNIANSPIDLEVTFTAGSGLAEDGWNLMSNPVPSAIDFSEVTLGANTFNGYYVYDPSDGSTETWDEDTESSSGSNLNGDIASSQGFWLKATAASPTNSSVAETAKVAGNGGPLFGGSDVPAFPIVRLNISSSINSFQDNTVVVFDLGAPEFEPIDAPKIFFSDASAPMIATLASTGEAMTFNKYGAITEGLSIPVKVQSYVAGTYTITAGISGNPFSCMWLEDTQTGTLTALTDGAQYSFQLAAGASTTPRFIMHSTAVVPLVLEPGLCGANGSATVDLGNNTADITWTTPTGTVVLEQPGATGENTFSTPVAGDYTVHISTNAVCGELVQDLYIDIEATEVVAAFVAPATVIVNEAIDFTNNSTVYGDFFWNFGDNATSTETNPEHTYTEPGTYTVTLEVTADDCVVITTQDVVVQVSTAIATIASTELNVWSNEQGIVVEHSFTEGTVKVEVLDATGSLHIQRQVAAAPGRILLDTDALNTGIWFVRVTNGERVQSFRVPLVR